MTIIRGLQTYMNQEVVPVNETVTLQGDAGFSHCFLTTAYYSDAEGQDQVTPTDGTLAVALNFAGSGNTEYKPQTSEINASDPVIVDWAGPTTAVIITPTSVTGADYMRVTLTQYKN